MKEVHTFFIDCDPSLFTHILHHVKPQHEDLNFLSGMKRNDQSTLHNDAKFYGLPSLCSAITDYMAVHRLLVPSTKYPTIASAVKAAKDNDVICLAGQAFGEPIFVKNCQVNLTVEGVADETMIKPCSIAERNAIRLIGVNGRITLRNLVLRTPFSVPNTNAVYVASSNLSVTLENCDISDWSLSVGISIVKAKRLTLLNTKVQSCGYGGITIGNKDCDVTIDQSEINFNRGDGIFAGTRRNVTITNSMFKDNKGSGVKLLRTSAIKVSECTFSRNDGYGMEVSEGTWNVVGCKFNGNKLGETYGMCLSN